MRNNLKEIEKIFGFLNFIFYLKLTLSRLFKTVEISLKIVLC
jgi:hypothetical protein